MCGRFTLTGDLAAFAARIAAKVTEKPKRPRYNVCPSQEVWVVTNESPREVTAAKWGLIAPWGLLSNARSEGIESKRSFSRQFREQRCVVLADGFFEWQAVPGQKAKIPHYIRLKSHEVFGIAAIWDDLPRTSCLITTSPNSLMAKLHDRMPVILTEKQCDLWLAPGKKTPEELKPLLTPYPAKDMEEHPVSTRVNFTKNDDPAVVEPV